MEDLILDGTWVTTHGVAGMRGLAFLLGIHGTTHFFTIHFTIRSSDLGSPGIGLSTTIHFGDQATVLGTPTVLLITEVYMIMAFTIPTVFMEIETPLIEGML